MGFKDLYIIRGPLKYLEYKVFGFRGFRRASGDLYTVRGPLQYKVFGHQGVYLISGPLKHLQSKYLGFRGSI